MNCKNIMNKFIMRSTKKISIMLSVLLLTSCSQNKNDKIYFEGKVKKETLSIASKIPGRIDKIFVNEADLVKAGDTLAIINIPEVEAKLEQANGAVAAAKAQYDMALNGATNEQIRQVMAMYNAAFEQYAFAEKSFQRIGNMYNDSLISGQQYDETYAKYIGAKSQFDAAKAKKEEVIHGVRDEKIRMVKGQLQQANGVLREAIVAYNERIIVAPKAMSIETIALHEGELALPGYNIFVGYETNTTYFRFTVSESQIAKYEIGKSYNVSLPYEKANEVASLVSVKQLAAYANKTSAYPNYQLGEAVYELKLVPEDQSAMNKLYINYTALLEKL